MSGQVVTTDVHALRRRAAGLATLVEVSGALAATLDLDRVLQTTTDGVCRLAGFDTAAVYLLEGETLRLGATTPALTPEFPEPLRLARVADHPHIRRCLERGAPVFVADYAAAQLSEGERLAAEHRSLRAILFAPMMAGVERVLGEVRSVLLDLSMPGMDGRATLDALLALDGSLRVVLSSGFDEEALVARGPLSRAAGFVQKPYTVAELRDALVRAELG